MPFLSTLSLRRATSVRKSTIIHTAFLSTLSLRRATVTVLGIQHRVGISIHALLAESDLKTPCVKLSIDVFLSTLSLRRATPRLMFFWPCGLYFYPRSPCGERRTPGRAPLSRVVDFYPRSPCGERHAKETPPHKTQNFYPRSPCGERLKLLPERLCDALFLSTLSLRRAT